MAIEQLARSKPKYDMGSSKPELISKELCPSGFKHMWGLVLLFMERFCWARGRDPDLPIRFLDLGSGSGQVVLAAESIGNVVATGCYTMSCRISST